MAGDIEGITHVDTLVEKFSDLANVPPATAIVQAHAQVEQTLRQKLIEAGFEDDADNSPNATSLARRAAARGLISTATVPAVEGITALRNLAAHRDLAPHGRDVTRTQADEYLNLADAVMFALKQPP